MQGKADPESRSKEHLRRQAGEGKEQTYNGTYRSDRQADGKGPDHPFPVAGKIFSDHVPACLAERDQEENSKKYTAGRLIYSPDRQHDKGHDERGASDYICTNEKRTQAPAVEVIVPVTDTRHELHGPQDHEQGSRQDMKEGHDRVLAETGVKRSSTPGSDQWDQSFHGQYPPDDHGNTDGGQHEHSDPQEAAYPVYCCLR